VLTHIFPPITLKQKTKNHTGDDKTSKNQVIHIKNGRYLGGQLEKSMLASASKGILHRIINNFSNETCVKFIDDLQNVITEYMKTSSFSVGVSDLIANKKTKQEILQVVQKQKQDVNDLIKE
jgi:DNA-directed RNA polymerase beta' subunit